jgi:hypothetical protein
MKPFIGVDHRSTWVKFDCLPFFARKLGFSSGQQVPAVNELHSSLLHRAERLRNVVGLQMDAAAGIFDNVCFIFFAGLATDYCVKFTALDALPLKLCNRFRGEIEPQPGRFFFRKSSRSESSMKIWRPGGSESEGCCARDAARSGLASLR